MHYLLTTTMSVEDAQKSFVINSKVLLEKYTHPQMGRLNLAEMLYVCESPYYPIVAAHMALSEDLIVKVILAHLKHGTSAITEGLADLTQNQFAQILLKTKKIKDGQKKFSEFLTKYFDEGRKIVHSEPKNQREEPVLQHQKHLLLNLIADVSETDAFFIQLVPHIKFEFNVLAHIHNPLFKQFTKSDLATIREQYWLAKSVSEAKASKGFKL